MSGKRAALKVIDWAKIAERVPEHEKPKFVAFRTKSDSYVRRINANPENPPKIDWEFYKKTVPVPGMVESFQKKYESMIIPFPSDNVTSLIDQQEQEVKKYVETFKTESNQRIQNYNAEIDRIKALLPYNQMTLEDFRDAHPDIALDSLNRPTFWPHVLEEQPDFVKRQFVTAKGGH